MILPLFIALGWSEQLLAVEWSKIDLAGFRKTPTVAANCVVICEAKGLGHGLEGVLDQAIRYYRTLELGQCRKIVLTDGLRLYAYSRADGSIFDENASGYVNFEKIREGHIAPRGTNAIATLFDLTPAMVSQ